jgi:NAD(P)-dependent dehydrogenase (short-subunit alcohol dehydrogenase family)
MPLSGIEGKVALVTGAARRRGIGRATALRLAREGADVACLDIARPYESFPGHGVATADELEEVVAEIAGMGRGSLALRADVSSWDQVHAAVEQVHAEFGRLDLVANVAGGASFGAGAGPLLQITEPEWDLVLDVNLKGTWMVSRAAAIKMVAQGGGRIVNVSSQAGKRGFATLGAYCAAKAGVILLTQTLALELGPVGVTVNAVCPGTVDTDLVNKDHQFEQLIGAMAPGGLEGWVQREIPVGRLETADEVAAAIAFLMSDDAAYITGEALNVSGGQTMA